MFYVYEWFVIDTDEVIYVGKGSKNRYKVRKHNRMFNDFIRRFPCDSRIVKRFEEEQAAFEYEAVYVAEMKEKGQCVCNINKGGSGGNIEWWTDERRKEYSENNVMKSQDQRKRMRENNPMQQKAISKKVAEKKKRAVVINGQIYKGTVDAAKKLNVATNTIMVWCKRGYDTNGNPCRYENEEQKPYKVHKTCSKVVYVDKRYFPSVKSAADHLGVWPETIIRSIKQNRPCKGHICRYGNQQPSCENPVEVSQKAQRLTGEDGNQ